MLPSSSRLHDSCLAAVEAPSVTDQLPVHIRVHTKYILAEAVDCTLRNIGV